MASTRHALRRLLRCKICFKVAGVINPACVWHLFGLQAKAKHSEEGSFQRRPANVSEYGHMSSPRTSQTSIQSADGSTASKQTSWPLPPMLVSDSTQQNVFAHRSTVLIALGDALTVGSHANGALMQQRTCYLRSHANGALIQLQQACYLGSHANGALIQLQRTCYLGSHAIGALIQLQRTCYLGSHYNIRQRCLV